MPVLFKRSDDPILSDLKVLFKFCNSFGVSGCPICSVLAVFNNLESYLDTLNGIFGDLIYNLCLEIEA